MEGLVKGVIKKLFVEYIEYIENTEHNRKKTIIKKKTSFSIDDEIFYTFEDIEFIEGKEEVFHANEKNQITLFGRDEIIEDLEIKAISKKKDIQGLIFLISLLSLLTFISIISGKLILKEDAPIMMNVLVFMILSSSFLFSIIGVFILKYDIINLKEMKETIKKQKEELSIFDKESSCPILIENNEKSMIKS